MMDNRVIRSLGGDSITEAMDLVWRVFLEFEAPEYSDEGIREFQRFIEPQAVRQKIASGDLLVWGYFLDGSIVGVIATRPPCHISLLFVDKAHQRKGIARALYETVLAHYRRQSNHSTMTVHSSPFALEAYRKLGFVDTDIEQVVNGLRFIPMALHFKDDTQSTTRTLG